MPHAHRLAAAEAKTWFDLVTVRFGFPEATFRAYSLWQVGTKYLAITPMEHEPRQQPEARAVGMSFLRINLRYPKLTTQAAMTWGRAAARNRVCVTPAQADAFLARQPIPLTDEQASDCTDLGYVLLQYRQWILGVGLYLPETPDGPFIKSLFPQRWAGLYGPPNPIAEQGIGPLA